MVVACDAELLSGPGCEATQIDKTPVDHPITVHPSQPRKRSLAFGYRQPDDGAEGASQSPAMPILMKAEVRGQTREGYQQTFEALAPHYAAANGFVAHLSHPIEGGWCVLDIWQSREQFERFYAQWVAPQLAPTVRPKVTFVQLHDVFVPAADSGAGTGAGTDAGTVA